MKSFLQGIRVSHCVSLAIVALALSAGKGGFTPPVTAPHGRFRPADLSLVDRRVSLITSMLATPA